MTESIRTEELIREALEQYHNGQGRDGHEAYAHLKKNAAGWLEYLLEENERLRTKVDVKESEYQSALKKCNLSTQAYLQIKEDNAALKADRDDFKHGHIMLQKENKEMKEVLEYIADVCLDKRCLKAANDVLSTLSKEATQ